MIILTILFFLLILFLYEKKKFKGGNNLDIRCIPYIKKKYLGSYLNSSIKYKINENCICNY